MGGLPLTCGCAGRGGEEGDPRDRTDLDGQPRLVRGVRRKYLVFCFLCWVVCVRACVPSDWCVCVSCPCLIFVWEVPPHVWEVPPQCSRHVPPPLSTAPSVSDGVRVAAPTAAGVRKMFCAVAWLPSL